MSMLRSARSFAALTLLVVGALILTSCGGAPAAYAAAAAAATTFPAAATPTGAAAAPSAATEPGRTITVVGHGEVKAKPDVAHSNIGIEVLAPTVADAMQQARDQMDAVIKALKAAGIADKDIQTSNFSINFERQQPPAAPTPAGSKGPDTGTKAVEGNYRVANMVNVTIRDLTKVGAVIDAAVNAGANNIYGISFDLENTSAQEVQARELAVNDARSRAQSLAKLTDVSLGNVVSVSEVIGSPVAPKFAMAQGLGGGGTPVEAGELTFSTDIQLVYAIQ